MRKNSVWIAAAVARPLATSGAAAQALLRAGLEPLRRLGTWRKRRLAIRELERLDAHLLADIGLDRGQIRFVVDGLTEAPARPAQEPVSMAPERCLDCGLADVPQPDPGTRRPLPSGGAGLPGFRQ